MIKLITLETVFVIVMFDYVISDLHLGHTNIIEYCDRPFSSKEEMDKKLINNWNSVVSPDDSVLYLGDLTLANPDEAIDYARSLNGRITLIQGNHDRLKMKHGHVDVVDDLTFNYGGFKFHCTHKPYDYECEIPNQWLIHGHTHNNEMDDFPFMNHSNKTINVSAELLDYTPLSFDSLVELIESPQWRYSYTNHVK